MANLWSFFGLPDPEGTTKKIKTQSKNQTRTSLENPPLLENTDNEIKQSNQQSLDNIPAMKVEQKPDRIPVPIPPNWRGPVSADGEPFHDLGMRNLARRSFPTRALRYVNPDKMKRIPTRGIAQRISNGDTVIVDLQSLVHMDTQQNACRRDLKMMSDELGVGIFALDADDKLLMIPGSDVMVDLGNYDLGLNTLMK